ncbi:MAG: hypothetical protein QM691_03545 [Opitutaceae bacterium]
MKDFLQNRPRVNSPLRGSADLPAGAAQPTPLFDAALLGTAHPGGGGHEPSVEAIKEGDRVTKLIVTCRCGEKIEILCAYAPGQR